jgi:hypothetical protein
MLPATSPTNPASTDAIRSETDRLRRRLRVIKRFRRKTLTVRANKLESLLSDLLLKVQSTFESSKPNSEPISATDVESYVSAEEHHRLAELFERSQQDYQALLSLVETEHAVASGKASCDGSTASPSQEIIDPSSPHRIPRPLSKDIHLLSGQIEFLESELAKVDEAIAKTQNDEKDLRAQIEILRTQLLESRHETIELRIQNAELIDRNQNSQKDLTWEQRKEQLLRQLACQSADGDEPDDSNRVREIILSSQRAIDQRDEVIRERDREIEELQMLLTRQSTVTDGFAVGAAAIAQILDTDEFIRSERENLRRLQCEWEEKLRNAEIEISMERAKIARERLEHETASATLTRKEENQAAIEVESYEKADSAVRKRRWLSRLGIRDE